MSRVIKCSSLAVFVIMTVSMTTFLPNAIAAEVLASYGPSGSTRWMIDLETWDYVFGGTDLQSNVLFAYSSGGSGFCDIWKYSQSGKPVGEWELPVACAEIYTDSDWFVLFGFLRPNDDSSTELFVSAFDSNGQEIWRNTCDELGGPRGIKRNTSGTFVVGGSTKIAWLNVDNGELSQAFPYYGNCFSYSPIFQVGEEGSVVVAGCSDYSTYLQWFDSAGNLTKTAEIPRLGDSMSDGEPQLIIDHQDNVLVANRCSSNEGCIARFDRAGTRLWSQRFPFSEDGSLPLVLAIDAEGQPVVAVNNWYYAEVIKFDTDGNELWNSRINNVEGVPNNNVYDIEVDREGNIYIIAELCDREGYDLECEHDYVRFVTIKFDKSGAYRWMVERDQGIPFDDGEPYSEGSIYAVYEWDRSSLYLSPELNPVFDDDTTDDDDQSSDDDDSDSAGCGC